MQQKFLGLALCVLLFSCQRAPQHSLNIRITKNDSSLLLIPNFLNPRTMTTTTTPSALSEFNCAGVALGYRSAPNKGLCTFSDSSVEGIGHLAGLVNFAKGTAQDFTIDNVLLGEDVRAFAVGFKDSSNYGCVNLGPDFKPEDYGYSEGYILASSNDFNTASNGVLELVSDYNSATTPYVSYCDPAILNKPETTTTASLSNNLTSYWDFNDNGNISDLHGNNNLTGFVINSSDNTNSRDSFQFVGSNQGLEASSATSFDLSVNSVMTLSFWMYKTAVPTSMVLFHKADGSFQNGWSFGFDGQGHPQPYVQIAQGGSSSQYNVSGTGAACRFISTSDPNTWIHYVIVIDFPNSQIKSYKNGVYCDSPPTFTQNTSVTTGVLKIGKMPPSTNEYTGLIDEVGIWSRELSASEVTRLYNSGNGLPYSSF